MNRILLVLVALSLAACAGQTPAVSLQSPVTVTASAPAQDPLAQLQAFTVADLQAASADAKAQTPPDTTASQCYDFLAVALPKLQGPQTGKTVGAVLAFQKLRDLHNGATSQSGALKNLNLACAPLVIDTQSVINKLILIGAGSAATGGAAAPFLNMLP